jgi:hypothetical protein
MIFQSHIYGNMKEVSSVLSSRTLKDKTKAFLKQNPHP